MWYQYSCGHRKYTPPPRSTFVKSLDYPCAKCVDKNKNLPQRKVEETNLLRTIFTKVHARVVKR